MFTCVMNVTVNMDTNNIKWWRRRIDNDSPSEEIKTSGNKLFSIANNNNGGILTSVLMINGLRSAFIGPYWVKMTDGAQLSEMAFLGVVQSGMYVYICVLCRYVYMCLCGCMYVHTHV